MTEQSTSQDFLEFTKSHSLRGGEPTPNKLQERYGALIQDFIGMFPKRNQGDDICQRHWLRLACAAVAVLERQPLIHVLEINFETKAGLDKDLSNYIASTEALKEPYIATSGRTPQIARKNLILKMVSLALRRVYNQDSRIRPKAHEQYIADIYSPIYEQPGWCMAHDAQMDLFVPRRYPSSNQVTMEEIVQAIRDDFASANEVFQQSEKVYLSEHGRQRIGFVYSKHFLNTHPVRVMEMFSIPTIYKEFDEEPVQQPTRAHLVASQDSFLGDLS